MSLTSKAERRRLLRAEAVERDGPMCVWPGCTFTHEHMAHIRGVGMGGGTHRDYLENVAMLCRYHHDLLDGRSHHGLRREVARLLAFYLDERGHR